MDDLEQQCEDALFELCDARERYPLRCVEELRKCIQLKNDINMIQIFQKSSSTDQLPVIERRIDIDELNKIGTHFERLDDKLLKIANDLDNLKNVLDQIERGKSCEMNKLLKT